MADTTTATTTATTSPQPQGRAGWWWSFADPDPISFRFPWARLWRPALLFVLTRAVILVTVWVASADEDAPVGGILPKLRFWDGDFYVAIARDGYPASVPETADGLATQSSLAFFPGFPLLGRGVSSVTGLGEDVALLVVAALAGLVASVLLWVLVAALRDEGAADRATLLYLAFPGAFVWSMVYAEPLLAAFGLACTMALLSRRWLLAGVLAALGTGMRPNGVVLVACCAVAAAAAIWHRREWRALIAPALAPIGWVGTIAYLGWHTGEPGAWFRVEREGWGEEVDLGRRTLARMKDTVLEPVVDGDPRWNRILPAVGVVLVVALGVALWRWRPPLVLWVYAAVIAALGVFSAGLGPRPRFVHTAWPLVAAGGVVLRRWAFGVAVLACMAAQVWLAYLSVTTTSAIP